MSGPALRRTRSTARSLRNSPAAVTITTRHLLRGTEHVEGVPQPWATDPGYRAALAAYRSGDLTGASDLGRRGGPAGRRLARLIDGEVAVLTAPVDGPPASWADPPTNRDRVLHLVTNALPETVAGYTVRTQGIAAAQLRAGHDVHVLTRLGFPLVKGHLSAAAEVDVDGVPHHRLLPLRLPVRADEALAADIERSARVVRRLRPTVLHAHSNHVNGRVGLALRARFGIPLVYEVRGLLEETWRSRTDDPAAARSDQYLLTRAAETDVMRAADAVVTLSESLRAEIVGRGVPAERVHVVPNGVDEDWLEPTGPIAPRPEGTLHVGLGGTLNAYEGVHVLVDAVARLRRRGIDVQLHVIGDGPARADLVRQAADRGIAEVTTFTGRLPRGAMIAAYRNLDVFCLPRLDLPVTRLVPPLKPVEAMALGLPVVASDLPPLREVVGGDRGLLVPAGDPQALAGALAGLATVAARRPLGEAARAWVAETRTWPAAATTYHRIYGSTRGRTHDRHRH